MRGWLVSVLVASLLLADGADAVAPCPAAARAGPQAGAQAAGCLSPGSTDCASALQRLASFADAAYGHGPTGTPPVGFHPVNLDGVALPAGRYRNGSVTALVMTAELDAAPALVIGFGGSDAPRTWLADLRDIDEPYRQFLPLIRAVEGYAAAGGHVILVGHSFGGAMVQLFMFAHPASDRYRAVTFGSPGALPTAGVFGARDDPRIANFVIADDPYVFLGEHRADVALYAGRNPLYAFALAGGIARESGLPVSQVMGSRPYLTANYVNNGSRIILGRGRTALSVTNVVRADPREHEIGTYVTLFGAGSG